GHPGLVLARLFFAVEFEDHGLRSPGKLPSGVEIVRVASRQPDERPEGFRRFGTREFDLRQIAELPLDLLVEDGGLLDDLIRIAERHLLEGTDPSLDRVVESSAPLLPLRQIEAEPAKSFRPRPHLDASGSSAIAANLPPARRLKIVVTGVAVVIGERGPRQF